jgi:hypothetical protein
MVGITTNAVPPSIGLFTRFETLGNDSMEDQMATLDLVNPGYFPTLDIPVIDGRVWNETENRT